LNSTAFARGYDSIATAISYAEEPAVPKFQNDGMALSRLAIFGLGLCL
jgi:hypothetical protein